MKLSMYYYLRGTTDLDLFYPKGLEHEMIDYVDVGHLLDPHKAKSHTRCVHIWRYNNLFAFTKADSCHF